MTTGYLTIREGFTQNLHKFIPASIQNIVLKGYILSKDKFYGFSK